MYPDPRIAKDGQLIALIRVDMLHKLQVYAAEHGYPLDAVVEEAIEEHLNRVGRG